MSKFLKNFALASAVVMGVGSAAHAVTVDNALINGNSLVEGATENSTALLFREATGVTITEPVLVDYLVGTNLSVGDTVTGINRPTSALELGAGTYNSYLIHHDPIVAGRTAQSFTLEPYERIVALIVSNRNFGRLLNQSDDVFGLDGVTYESNTGRRAENNDNITLISGNTILFDTFANGDFVDDIRVITAVVPLPAGGALLLTGLAAFGAVRRKG